MKLVLIWIKYTIVKRHWFLTNCFIFIECTTSSMFELRNSFHVSISFLNYLGGNQISTKKKKKISNLPISAGFFIFEMSETRIAWNLHLFEYSFFIKIIKKHSNFELLCILKNFQFLRKLWNTYLLKSVLFIKNNSQFDPYLKPKYFFYFRIFPSLNAPWF